MMLRITFLTFNDFWGRVVLHETLADECVLDAVLSLGALDQAWDHDRATRNYRGFGAGQRTETSLACASSSSCYRDAVKHYSRSVQRLHRRLKAVSALAPESRHQIEGGESTQAATEVRQLVPVLTMLYCLFEWLHGDECAHDRLLSNGLSMAMGDALLPVGTNGSTTGRNTQLSRALVDVAGTSSGRFFEQSEDASSLLVRWIVLSWIQWPAFSTSAAAVARDYDLHAGRGRIDLMSLPPPPATLAERGYESVGGMVVKLVTLVTLWFMRLRVDGVDDAVTAAVAGKEGAVLDRLREEQHRLEEWVCEWEVALSGKAAVETNSIGKMLLKEFLFGFETLRFMVQVGVPGSEAEARSVLTAHRIMDDIEARVRVNSALGKVGLGECEPTPLGLICRECRDMEARARALTVCRWASQAPRALWDAKGSMIGSNALAALEEQSRDGTTGQVARESQWRWVHAAWADGHELLEVTFRSVVPDDGGQFRYRTSRLATVDYGFVAA